jgi:hypothetical protein
MITARATMSSNWIAASLTSLLAIATGLAIAILDPLSFSYSDARVAYGLLAVLALLLILGEIKRWKAFGALTPLSTTIAGFLYFFCYFPLFNPGLVPDLYGDSSRFTPLVLLVALGMICFAVGYYLAPTPRLGPIDKWLDGQISTGRLAHALLVVFAGYVLIALYMSSSGGFSALAFVLQSNYRPLDLFGVSYEGLSYYLQQIFRWLPIAMAAPGAYCVLDRQLSAVTRGILAVGLIGAVVVTLNLGIRYVLAYVVGAGGCLYLFSSARLSRQFILGRIRIVLLLLFALFLLSLFQFQVRNAGGLQTLLEEPGVFDLSDALSNSRSELGADQNYTVDSVLHAEQVGVLHYTWGESYILNFVMFIPRSFWPEKPGAELAAKWRVANPFSIDNVAYSAIGELILNFSRYAVIPGMLISGLLAGLWWRAYQRHRLAPRTIILYSMSPIAFAFLIRGSFTTMFGALVYPMLITVGLLCWASTGKSQS